MKNTEDRIMRTFIALCLIGLVVALVGCGETTSPVDGPISFKRVKTATVETSDEVVISEPTVRVKPSRNENSSTGEAPPNTIVQSPDAPALMTYDTTFTAIQGQGNTFVLFYENPWTLYGTPGDWFMKLEVPSDAQFINELGEPYAYGDVVEITAHVDQTKFLVQFGPHGSTFLGKQPAVLMFNYLYADLGNLSPTSLTVFYQPSVGVEWAPEATIVDKRGNRILVDIYHFSNYAVAW